MAARAILTCRPNSHPFQDRGVSLDQPVKIGRSVARARPNPSNAIFDCKVLSRNHALLWYDTGKFYLQDTKSSNGTFVNNQRLSKSSEESAPREVCSGDIVQFGVDVMELNKKVTHGCIVATLQLFLPDGKEAKASSSTVLPDKIPTSSVQEIYQLNQFIKEAIQREQMIENKLATINTLMASTKDSVESNWKVLIEEDRLLTRVDILERQLQTSHKTMTDDKLREEVLQLHEDKEKYQIVAKEALRKAAQERMEALKHFNDLQRNLSNTEEEKSILKDMFDRNCQELKELVEKYEQCELKSKELAEEMDQSSTKYKEEVESLNNKIKESELLIENKQQIIDSLMAKIDTENAKKVTHNQDLTNISTNEIIQDNDSMSKGDVEYPDGNMNVHWENPAELETLKSQIKSADQERQEILLKLSHLLNLIEDLKAVSNKVQVSEFIQELIHKLDLEVRQIRNFSQGEEPLKNNSYSIEVESEENKMENHMVRRSSEGFEKLLEESRQIAKTLQTDNVVIKKENEILQQQIDEFASQIKTYQEKTDTLSEANSELQSRVGYLQSQLDSSEKDSQEVREKLQSLKHSAAMSDSQIEQLKGEIASLESIAKQRDETIVKLMDQLGDLNKRKEASALVEVACQTLRSLATADDDISAHNESESNLQQSIVNDNGRGVSTGQEDSYTKIATLNEQLMRFEEELVNYKCSYNESSAECATLRRKLVELQSQHEHIQNQSKLMVFCCSFPVLILIVALVVAFYPTVSLWTATME